MAAVVKLLLVLGLIALIGGAVKVAQDTRGAVTVGASPTLATDAERPCAPGDQDPFVYRPERLQFLRPCLRVTGVVRFLFVEDDGDVHLRVALDPPYGALLVAGNYTATEGELVVEPVCYGLALHADALRLCAADPDPVSIVPRVGEHVWMEGRYVLDIGHTAWAELHPLYRWGAVGQ